MQGLESTFETFKKKNTKEREKEKKKKSRNIWDKFWALQLDLLPCPGISTLETILLVAYPARTTFYFSPWFFLDGRPLLHLLARDENEESWARE